jgi:hypothetical protein
MSITLFGSCRINDINNNNNINNLINYTHSTKEVIQFILFLTGKLNLPEPYNMYCFRTGICKNINICYNDSFKQLFDDTKIFVIEICSSKKYIHNGYYLHHLCVDTRLNRTVPNVLNGYTLEIQTYDEIQNDILEIKQLLHPRKFIIVSHYNVLSDGKYFESRNNLICMLQKICNDNNILFVNPTEVLKNYKQEYVMTNDLSHYSDVGINAFTKYMNTLISSI